MKRYKTDNRENYFQLKFWSRVNDEYTLIFTLISIARCKHEAIHIQDFPPSTKPTKVWMEGTGGKKIEA